AAAGSISRKAGGLGVVAGVVADGQRSCPGPCECRTETHIYGAIGTGGERAPAVAAGGIVAAGADITDIQRAIAGIGQREWLGRTGGADLLVDEIQTGRRETYSRGCTRTGDTHTLRTEICIVGESDGSGSQACCTGRECNRNGAV